MNFEKIKTLSFLEFVPLCSLMLVKRSKNLLYIDTTDPNPSHDALIPALGVGLQT